MSPLNPGATIGILGGGQLGRMLALAAARLGFQCHIFTPAADDCALAVVEKKTIASYSDSAALHRFASDCQVITYEFENVPHTAAIELSRFAPVLPDPGVLEITQDRLVEKDFVRRAGAATTPYIAIDCERDIPTALQELGAPAILKTRRMGYDGKGQVKITSPTDAAGAWQTVGGAPSILESFVDFEREISVIAARSGDGNLVAFDVSENRHQNHILKNSLVPANISGSLADEAISLVDRIATAFDYVGVLAVEMFVSKPDSKHPLMVNEIAPRVHNSGHWTIDGATISQFEQHIRAITGWPLGSPIRHGRVEMTNLIGAEVESYQDWLNLPGATVHLYDKGTINPGRKMGHVTQVFESCDLPAA